MADEIEKWLEAQEFQVALDEKGRIVDYLEPEKKRDNKPEERVRQKTSHILHEEYGYPKSRFMRDPSTLAPIKSVLTL